MQIKHLLANHCLALSDDVGYVRDGQTASGNRVRPLSKFFGHNPVLIDLSELNTKMPSFSKLDNVYIRL